MPFGRDRGDDTWHGLDAGPDRSDVHVRFGETYARSRDVVISTLRAELSSSIDRARAGEEIVVTDRTGRLSSEDRLHAESRWRAPWGGVRPVELTPAVATLAGDLAGRHALRGAEAVHPASLSAFGVENTIFVAWDRRLRSGAEAVGARLVPVA